LLKIELVGKGFDPVQVQAEVAAGDKVDLKMDGK